jgi:hypothetical protein
MDFASCVSGDFNMFSNALNRLPIGSVQALFSEIPPFRERLFARQ